MAKGETIPCTREEMEALIKAAVDDDFYYTLFLVAKTTGRRIGEYYNVRVKDIDFEKGIMLTEVLKRKRFVQKEAILRADVAHVLERYCLRNKLKLEDYVFRKSSIRQIQNKVKTYAKKAKIDHNVTFHNFRHFFVTELVRQGWSYDKITKLTGHSSPGSLVAYDHAVASDIKDDALEALKSI